MLNDRQINILKLLAGNVHRSVNNLSEQLGVSSATIRQDLKFMETEDLIKRVHGGAVLHDADDLSNRLGYNYEKKLRIAQKTATLVSEGETILIESGSANALLARELVKKKNITLVTTNVFIARQFRNSDQSGIILTGGSYQPASESLVGKITKASLDQLNFDKAFIGIDGYTTNSGFTLRDMFRAEISSYIIKKASETIIVTDSSKFGKIGLTRIGYPCDIKRIATDFDLDDVYIEEFRKAGIELILA
jgi:DeoR/GlpR family transcriptional regulator of sugar metabolism